jgi:DNA-binding NarL/FixJ family response regulator
METLILKTWDWVPVMPRGFVRDIRVRWALEEAGFPYRVESVPFRGRAIDPQLAVDAWSESDPLNDRERQVLRLAGDGLSAADIATLLNLSSGTVRNYLSEAIGKLGAGNRIEAFRLARQKGWL